ncbi:MAG: hypothetical protein ACRCX2_24135 [Paraclostridium sp.]
MKSVEIEVSKYVDGLISELNDIGLSELQVLFSDTVERSFETRGNGYVEEMVVPDDRINKKYGLKFLDVLKESLSATTDLDVFSDKIDELIGTKPHQTLTLGKSVHYKNSITISCSKEQCDGCFNMFTCQKNQKGKMYLIIELSPDFVVFKTKKTKLNEFDILGQSKETKFRFKKSQHLSIFLGKLMYEAISSNYEMRGFNKF